MHRDQNGKETVKNCYPITKQITDFVGLKSFGFDTDKGITEILSHDYKNLFAKLYSDKTEYTNLQSRRVRNAMMRVGFVGDSLYMFNNDFANFFLPGTQKNKYLYFDPILNGKEDCAKL
ncbi:MAG: hypothetical protein GXP45_03155 [bacterium]|nr:hypothetical protein [bacterium]